MVLIYVGVPQTLYVIHLLPTSTTAAGLGNGPDHDPYENDSECGLRHYSTQC